MLTDEIRRRMLEAMKAKDDVTKGILRVALGEVQSTQVSKGATLEDEDVVAILRKLVKSAEETLGLAPREDQKAKLVGEIEALRTLLPQTLDATEIAAALDPVLDAIRGAKGDGQATGIAMKHLKSTGAAVTGQDVAAAVRRMRE